MAKQVKQLDRVIIRFAGDSGDGMQLTGDRFTQESAAFGNDLIDAAELPGRDPRAPGHAARASRRSRCTSPTTTSSPPGDSPDVLVAMNPAALKANLPDMKPGTSLIVDSHDFTARNLTKAGYADNPLEDDSLADYARHRRRPDRDDGRGGQGVRALPQGRRAARRTCSPSGCSPGCTAARPRPPSTFLEQALRQGARHPRRQRHRVQGRLELRRDHRGVRGAVRDQAGADVGRHLPQHHRQPGAGLRPGRRRRAVRAADLPRHLPDHPGLRHPPRAEQAQALRDHHLPGRGRDRRHRRRARRLVRRLARRHQHLGPRHRAEVGDHRARGDDRAAAAGRSTSSAAAPRPGCPPRPSRPTCSRRCSAATARPRSRSWRRSHPATASTPPSRRSGSRSPTAPR